MQRLEEWQTMCVAWSWRSRFPTIRIVYFDIEDVDIWRAFTYYIRAREWIPEVYATPATRDIFTVEVDYWCAYKESCDIAHPDKLCDDDYFYKLCGAFIVEENNKI